MIAFRIYYLTGQARSWAMAEWNRRSAVCYSLPESLKIFTQIFKSITPDREATKALVSLRQGKWSIID